MDDMAIARINGGMITWARKRFGASVESIATKNITPPLIQSWEEGKSFPTETQAMSLADRLGIAYPMLFIPVVPPDEKIKIPDLRTISGRPLQNPSRNFLAVLDDSRARQQWISAERRDIGEKPLGFVGKFGLQDSTDTVAENMRQSLILNAHLRKESKDFEEFLRRLVLRAEDLGVLVMRSTIVRHITNRSLDADEFRGFNLIDRFAPVVFINDDDVKAAQVFTFAHELAHIWIGEEGVSDRRPQEKGNSSNAIEVFCDKVAAEVLVPRSEFTRLWDNSKNTSVNVSAASSHFKVSELVTLRRAKDLSKISSDYFFARISEKYDAYRRKEEEQIAKQKAKPKDAQGGNFWASFDLRNSARFNRTVAASVAQQRLTYTEASSLLGVSVLTTASYIKRLRAE
jgi:Zn-dependent peptidase ImmA (M78 family)